jgi:hypothetical protein
MARIPGLKTRHERVLALAMVALAASGLDASRGRYHMATFLTTRTHFQYVQDSQTGKWVNRTCELRVADPRPLPEPLQDDEHGSRLSVEIFKPESVESGLLLSIEFKSESGYRIWPAAVVLDEDDLKGRVAYGVQVSWPETGKPTRTDPLEMIAMPPLGDTPPQRWSEWLRAGQLREGQFAWWKQVNGAPEEPVTPPRFPFEIRCKLTLADTPGVVP